MVKHALPSLSQQYENLVKPSAIPISQKLANLEQWLLHSNKICREPGDAQDAEKLFTWVTVAIKPVGNILIQDNNMQMADLVSTSRTGFTCIQRLQVHFLSQETVSYDAL